MDADVILDGNVTRIEGDFVRATAVDLNLDAPSRRKQAGGQRRAMVHNFDDGLTLNWDSDYPDGVTIEGFRVKLHQADVVIDHAARRKTNTPWRRALVHDFDDGLTINWAHDYPGGVTINGPVRIKGNLTVDGTITENSPLHIRPDLVGDLVAKIGVLEARLKKLEG